MKLTRLLRLMMVVCCLAALPLYAKNTKPSNRMMRVYDDATRLASLLRDVQTTANISGDVWKTVVNEANALSNRIYGNTAGNSQARAAARDLRMHVREMRAAALAGDAAGARTHASQALPFALTLIDWSMQK